MSIYLGSFLKRKIQASGLTSGQCARLIGLSSLVFQDILDGRSSASDTHIRYLASIETLGVTVEELRFWKVLDFLDADVVKAASRLLKELKLLPAFEPEPHDALNDKITMPEPRTATVIETSVIQNPERSMALKPRPTSHE